jgi:hypothetical protein
MRCGSPLHFDGGALVHTGWTDHPGCVPGRWFADEPPRERDGIDPDIEHGATTLGRVEQPVRRSALGGKGEVTLDRNHLAEFAGVETSLQFHVEGIEAHPHRFHEEAPTRRGHGKHVVNLRRVHRERLLDEHMLAGFHHQDRLLAVDGVDAGHIHDVDFGVARKIGHRSVHVRNVS